jgi:hypothetical protein
MSVNIEQVREALVRELEKFKNDGYVDVQDVLKLLNDGTKMCNDLEALRAKSANQHDLLKLVFGMRNWPTNAGDSTIYSRLRDYLDGTDKDGNPYDFDGIRAERDKLRAENNDLKAELKHVYEVRELAFKNWDAKVERANKILAENAELKRKLSQAQEVALYDNDEVDALASATGGNDDA